MDKMWNHEVEDGIGFEFLPKFAKKKKKKKKKKKRENKEQKWIIVIH